MIMSYSLGIALAFVALAWSLRRRVRWFRRRKIFLGRGTGWGTVYVFRDRSSRLVKVGTTCRKSVTRKREVSRDMLDGADLVQVYAVDMPFARAVETEVHRKLRRHRARRGQCRELYWAADDGNIDHVVQAIRQSAWAVRKTAEKNGRWQAWMDAKARTVVSGQGKLTRAPLFVPQSVE